MPTFTEGINTGWKPPGGAPERECLKCHIKWVPQLREHVPYKCPQCGSVSPMNRWVKRKG